MGLTYYPSPRAHAALNPDALRETFVADKAAWDGRPISSAYDLHAVETLRERHGLGAAKGVPTDVFVWGQGEPKDRTVTKVGGLPCWGAETPWPERDGVPRVFLAQFSFRDSLDLVGTLPGELLVVFTDPEFSWVSGDPDGLLCQWVSVGTGRLIVERLLPKPRKPFFKGYGIIHRTRDHPEAQEGAGIPVVLNATKIGGVPSGEPVRMPEGTRFLAQLASIQAAPHVDYPWVNHPRPLDLSPDPTGIHGETNQLRIGDAASLQLHLHGDGRVGWAVSEGGPKKGFAN